MERDPAKPRPGYPQDAPISRMSFMLLRRDFDKLVAELDTQGWAVSSGSLISIKNIAQVAGWRLRPGTEGSIRPTRREDAPPNSLSAQFGLDAQPLHTDGAHERQPPEVVLLASANSNETPTRLLRIPDDAWTPQFRDACDHGVFKVRNGANSFLCHATLGYRGLRFDPGCMHACDQRSTEVARSLTTLEDRIEPTEHRWKAKDLLLIDNRRTLHGRGVVAVDDQDRVLERAWFDRRRLSE